MNILFFLTPKSEVAYINEDDTIRQALEKMEYHRFSSVPIISKTGRYVGTITEGDLLWGIKNEFGQDFELAGKLPVTALRRRLDYRPVKVDAYMEDLLCRALNQNFVPVLDDHKSFIGIVTRKDILRYYGRLSRQADAAALSGQEDGTQRKKNLICEAVKISNASCAMA